MRPPPLEGMDDHEKSTQWGLGRAGELDLSAAEGALQLRWLDILVQRGAPRDFTDIRQLVTAGHLTPAECWHLWERKNPDLNPADARAEVARHLHELELRRPLDTLTDLDQREQARQTRAWFRAVFSRPSQA
jgi:hypothetical protein